MRIWCLDYRDDRYTDALMHPQVLGLSPFRGTELIERFPENAVIEIRSRRPPTDFFKTGLLWIISSKLQNILESQKVEAEYLPVQLHDRKGQPLDGAWFCFNATLIVDWFDREKSHFTDERGFATKIRRVAVDPDRFGDSPLSVAQSTIPALIGVRDDVAANIVSSGCTGVIFCKPQKWQNPVNPIT